MRRRHVLVGVIGAVLLVVGYPLWIGYQVWDQSHKDELHSADAIVVLGAAQYDGRPSPVFKARLDQAAFLYQEDLSDRVIVTGGKRPGDRFTEAEAGSRYLSDEQGIPEAAILGEAEGASTWESLQNVDRLAEEHGIATVLLVSDPMHSERLKRMAGDLGFEASYTSWASYERLDRSRATKARELIREVGSIIAHQLFD